MFILYILLAVIAYSYYYNRTGDLLCPHGIFLLMWWVCAAISCFEQNDFLDVWKYKTHLVVVISGISYFIGTIRFLPRRKRIMLSLYECMGQSTKFTRIIWLLFFICFVCSMIEWVNGGARLVTSYIGTVNDVKSELGVGSISGVHYGTLFLPYVAILFYYKYLNSVKKQFIDIFIILLIVMMSIFINFSRGDLMIYITSFSFLYTRYNTLNIRKTLVIASVLFGIIIGFAFLRVDEDSMLMTMTANPIYSIFYSYIATCYANLNDLISSNIGLHPAGNMTFAPLWTILGIRDEMFINVVAFEQLDMFNARTYLYPFYHDYGLIGCIIFPLLMGSVYSFLYTRACVRGNYWVLPVAFYMKAFTVPFFGNYFFGELVILFPFLLIYLIVRFKFNIKSNRFLNYREYHA